MPMTISANINSTVTVFRQTGIAPGSGPVLPTISAPFTPREQFRGREKAGNDKDLPPVPGAEAVIDGYPGNIRTYTRQGIDSILVGLCAPQSELTRITEITKALLIIWENTDTHNSTKDGKITNDRERKAIVATPCPEGILNVFERQTFTSSQDVELLVTLLNKVPLNGALPANTTLDGARKKIELVRKSCFVGKLAKLPDSMKTQVTPDLFAELGKYRRLREAAENKLLRQAKYHVARSRSIKMTFFVKRGIQTDLFSEPTATSTSKDLLPPNKKLGDPLGASDGFLLFALGAPNDDALKGWVLKSDCEDRTDDASRPPLNAAAFVQECVNVQLLFNDETKPVEGAPPAVLIRPWVVSADFLIARALYETDIRNLGKNIPGSDGVGPLQVTVAEWKDFTDNGGVLARDARASDRDHSVLQIAGAAYRQHVHGKAMSKIRLDAGKATAEDPFVASFLDMFFAHVTNSPAAAIAILDAQDAGTAPDTSIKEVLKAVMTAEELSALFKAREKVSGLPTVFFGTEANPSTLKSVVDIAEDTLKKLLVAAFARIEKHRPEMIPKVTAGGAPWMAVAEQAEADGVKEGTHNTEISGYFTHTDFGGNPNTNPPPAWCGAFAAHCMKRCDNPIVQASVPREAAAAISWRKWGADIPWQSATIPRGAVVVLSPSPGTTGGTGHVGFFQSSLRTRRKSFYSAATRARGWARRRSRWTGSQGYDGLTSLAQLEPSRSMESRCRQVSLRLTGSLPV